MGRVGNVLRRNAEAIIVLCAVLVVLIGAIFVNRPVPDNAARSGAGQQPIVVADEPTATQPEPEEIRLTPIQEHQEMFPGGSAIEPARSDSLDGASFGIAEVQDYVEIAYPGSEIASLEFMEAGEVEERFETGTGFFGARLLAVVTLRGEFVIGGPPEAPAARSDVMVTVFDARTGNELMRTYVPMP